MFVIDIIFFQSVVPLFDILFFFSFSLEKFPSKKTLWQCAAMHEKAHGTPESLEAKLLQGVKHCPHGEVLWLMAAKEKWLAGNIGDARTILVEAFKANPKVGLFLFVIGLFVI